MERTFAWLQKKTIDGWKSLERTLLTDWLLRRRLAVLWRAET